MFALHFEVVLVLPYLFFFINLSSVWDFDLFALQSYEAVSIEATVELQFFFLQGEA